MGDVSNKTIVALLAVALVITVIGTVISVNKLSNLGGQYDQITGRVVDTGTTSITLAGTAAITMDDATVNFGSGYVTEGSNLALLDSNDTSIASWIGWTNTTAFTDYSMIVSNSGTVPLVLNISSETDAHAEAWLCSGDSCTSTDANLEVKATNKETSACTSSGNLQSAYTNILTDSAKTTVTLCDEFDYDSDSDEIYVFFNATVPKDAQTGAHALTVTFTAIDSTS
ncbi:MAG: hypothetical protein KKH52_02500 [Nanoarchaeota archaeon]|nr:hypothetical protein [Nanoarchaeota archaeon]MBU1974243.1 hypothetical protein [Nanoarchaeota archaeon]